MTNIVTENCHIAVNLKKNKNRPILFLGFFKICSMKTAQAASAEGSFGFSGGDPRVVEQKGNITANALLKYNILKSRSALATLNSEIPGCPGFWFDRWNWAQFYFMVQVLHP